ncbi:hypothetical protein K7432_013056 [Basidiobolus ranarum]|uniref:N-acetyltransferase domain-containing protein n=1 Tax=Basidiobolus ranarum TaxID=34480 RepID=A0ABR2VRR4_9FUNG
MLSMTPSVEPMPPTVNNITVRMALPSDALPVAELQLEVYRIAYAHILPHSYLNSDTLYSELLTKREKYYGAKYSPEAVFLVCSTEAGVDDPTLSSVGAICEAGPIRAYPGLEGIENFDPSNTLELWTNYVHRSYQGRGVGQRLFIATVEAAVEKFPQYAGRMMVITFEQNTGGRRFYEKMGGKLFGILPNYPIEGQEYPVACYEWRDMTQWLERWRSSLSK